MTVILLLAQNQVCLESGGFFLWRGKMIVVLVISSIADMKERYYP